MHKSAALFFSISLVSGFAGEFPLAAQRQGPAGEQIAPAFPGPKSDWHGFDRYDFEMDEETLAIIPFLKPENEKFGIGDPQKGKRRCVVVVPKKAAPRNPW